MKKCTKCKTIKPKSEFHKQRCKADGLRYHCKICRSVKAASHFKINKVKVLERNKKYYEANKKDIQIKNKVYYDDKYNNDINFRLAHTLRARLNGAIKNNQKAGSAVNDLGCTVEELRIYLEARFQEGMSWDKRKEWHIDHIKPLASFDLSNREEFLEACNYSNLQPLWAKDNLKKNKY